MLNTYIKNRGTTKTIIHENNHNKVNTINWDADYDGETAHISLDSNVNGRKDHYNIELDNEDLANLLNIPTINHDNIEYPLYIRGELVMYNSDFIKYKDSYNNPRNLVAGAINSKNKDKNNTKKNITGGKKIHKKTIQM